MFQRRDGAAFARLVENSGGHFFGTKIRETVVHAVVGQAAALRMEERMALVQRADEGAEAVDVRVGGGGELAVHFAHRLLLCAAGGLLLGGRLADCVGQVGQALAQRRDLAGVLCAGGIQGGIRLVQAEGQVLLGFSQRGKLHLEQLQVDLLRRRLLVFDRLCLATRVVKAG